MDPEKLPDPGDLWWSWVVLAALHAAQGEGICRYDPGTGVLHLDTGADAWVRMQRVLGLRVTLWGRSPLAPASAPDARLDAPDWAVTDATLVRRPSFVAWHAHGEWDAGSPGTDEGALHLLRPILTVDPRLVEQVRSGSADATTLAAYLDEAELDDALELIRLARRGAVAPTTSAVRTRLRHQIHDQMRDAEEIERLLVQRPAVLVQWLRVNGPGVPFSWSVMAMRDRLTACPTNPRLPDLATRTLTTVLRVLHHEEKAEGHGTWMFARVSSGDGLLVNLDRRYDSWPGWYQVSHHSQGPTLEDLAWEMDHRPPRWRPAWSTLLPH